MAWINVFLMFFLRYALLSYNKCTPLIDYWMGFCFIMYPEPWIGKLFLSACHRKCIYIICKRMMSSLHTQYSSHWHYCVCEKLSTSRLHWYQSVPSHNRSVQCCSSAWKCFCLHAHTQCALRWDPSDSCAGSLSCRLTCIEGPQVCTVITFEPGLYELLYASYPWHKIVDCLACVTSR